MAVAAAKPVAQPRRFHINQVRVAICRAGHLRTGSGGRLDLVDQQGRQRLVNLRRHDTSSSTHCKETQVSIWTIIDTMPSITRSRSMETFQR